MPAVYRAEVVGSFLRPPELLKARADHAAGKLKLEDLHAAEDRAILSVFEGQRKAGMPLFTDGELRRGSWLTDMADAVEGFVADKVILDWKGPGGGFEASSAQAVGAKLKKTRKLTAHEFPFLKKSAPGPFKITVPAPSNFMVSSYKRGLSNRFYPTRAELLHDLVEIVRDEIKWLVAEGATYIQLDAPFYSHYVDSIQRGRLERDGLNPEEEFRKSVAADNSLLKDIPRSRVTVSVHVCRGNSRSRWYTEGSYDFIAETLFNMLDVDNFLLEYDTERAGSFQPLRFVPQGKRVVLGLVTSKTPKLESQDELRRRVDEAARYIPLDNLAISTQCGFAAVAAGNLLTIDEQWRKLELVASTARRIWG
jgi:5-methyltetrahydropteroyltriglutamate--homocysteine methyltransferase